MQLTINIIPQTPYRVHHGWHSLARNCRLLLSLLGSVAKSYIGSSSKELMSQWPELLQCQSLYTPDSRLVGNQHHHSKATHLMNHINISHSQAIQNICVGIYNIYQLELFLIKYKSCSVYRSANTDLRSSQSTCLCHTRIGAPSRPPNFTSFTRNLLPNQRVFSLQDYISQIALVGQYPDLYKLVTLRKQKQGSKIEKRFFKAIFSLGHSICNSELAVSL